MFSLFRFRSALFPVQQFQLTGRWFADVIDRDTGVTLGRRLVLGVVTGLLAIALWGGTAIAAPAALAAATPEAEAYAAAGSAASANAEDPGPIRQTRNPLSDENFNGGVNDSALEKTENRRLPEEDDQGLLETLKDKVTGNDAHETPTDLKTEKNPTLERYPKSLD